ncbi:MAG: hypothetical protein Q8876_03915 [Bacillota bacterium]|nr:hypothetical protein [Bacillota bacterium]
MATSKLSDKVSELEAKLAEERAKAIGADAEIENLYSKLKETSKQLAVVISQRENEVAAYDKELRKLIRDKAELAKRVEYLAFRENQFIEFSSKLSDKIDAATEESYRIIENAQIKAMDSVRFIDKIIDEMNVFKIDLQLIKKDINIGTITLEDRVDMLYYKLKEDLGRLIEIKMSFFTDNNIYLDEDAKITKVDDSLKIKDGNYID